MSPLEDRHEENDRIPAPEQLIPTNYSWENRLDADLTENDLYAAEKKLLDLRNKDARAENVATGNAAGIDSSDFLAVEAEKRIAHIRGVLAKGPLPLALARSDEYGLTHWEEAKQMLTAALDARNRADEPGVIASSASLSKDVSQARLLLAEVESKLVARGVLSRQSPRGQTRQTRDSR